MRVLTHARATALLAAGLVLATTGTAGARTVVEPATPYQMPFRCGQVWTGTSRADHSPSPLAIDFNRVNDEGQPAVAAAPGVVSRAADLGDTSYGRYVIVDHGNGTSTVYAHLLAIWVTQGESVDQGQLVGLVGGTGNATGPHLHFEERLNGTDQPAWFAGAPYVMGTAQESLNCPDVPLAGSWDGAAADEVGVYRRELHSRFRLRLADGTTRVVVFGRSTDQPLTGDWNGDGTTDVGVRRPGSSSFLLRNADGSVTTVKLGRPRDIGVTGDWEGAGGTEVGVWRPATATYLLRMADGTVQTVRLGSTGDLPVTGDWNGDGVTDLGVYDPASATFTMRVVDRYGDVWTSSVPFGGAGDLPVTGDWDGDGVTDLGVWAPSTATFTLRAADPAARSTSAVTTLRYGRRR